MTSHRSPESDLSADLTCEQARELLSAYVDDELPALRAAAVGRHVASCAECARDLEALQRTSTILRRYLRSIPAPDVLRARVRGALRDAPAEQDRSSTAGARSRRSRLSRMATPLAAGLIIAAASSAITLAVVRPPAASPPAFVAHDVLQSHVRALMTDHLTDVISTDEHTVKPWFNGRVDFSPKVVQLDFLGFPLLGGRVDHVGDHPVAALVYARRKHRIDLFTWPTTPRDPAPPTDSAIQTERGYHALHWTRDGMEYWAVSDVNESELRQFAALFVRYGP